MFSLFFLSRIVLISFISSITCSLFRNVWFKLHVCLLFKFVFFFYSYNRYLVSQYCVQRKCLINYNTISLNLLRFDLWPKMRKMFHVHLRRKCILHLDGMCWRYLPGLFALIVPFRLMFPYLFSVLTIYPLVEVGC